KTARIIERSVYAEYYERNRRNIKEKEKLYKRRQAIAEHPFGTMKRQWRFSYVLTKKGIKRASVDVGFMFIAYNLRRVINILGADKLREYLRALVSVFLSIIRYFRPEISLLQTFFPLPLIGEDKFPASLKPA
ncbi:MAG: transposase, partial [Bacteroidales bacterium]|nr:transposase [Bacteroidales bacterium]